MGPARRKRFFSPEKFNKAANHGFSAALSIIDALGTDFPP
jgi:hypothetical protein